MESEQSNSSKMETFRLFDDNPQPRFGLSFLESPEKPFPPPPPCIEVLPSQVLFLQFLSKETDILYILDCFTFLFMFVYVYLSIYFCWMVLF